MRASGNFPQHVPAQHADVGAQRAFPRRELRRLGGNERRRARTLFRGTEILFGERENRVRVRVAGGGDADVRWNVSFFEIRFQFPRRHVRENVFPPDDGDAVRMNAERFGERRVGEARIGIVRRHVDFAQNDVLFPFGVARVEPREKHDLRKRVEGRFRGFGGNVGVIDGAVEGRVGVEASADGLHAAHDFLRAVFFRALERHVFEVMRKPAAEKFLLVDAAGLHPDLHGKQTRRERLPEKRWDAASEPRAARERRERIQNIHTEKKIRKLFCRNRRESCAAPSRRAKIRAACKESPTRRTFRSRAGSEARRTRISAA